jgi:hypothetical protein
MKQASIARIKKAPANCRGLIVFVGMITGSSNFLEDMDRIVNYLNEPYSPRS